MKMPDEASKVDRLPNRRNRTRSKELTNPMAVIRSSGGPLYQLKVGDLSDEGAAIIVRPDSNFLQLIQVGEEVNVRMLLPRNYSFKGPSGDCRSRVAHITEIQEGPFKGHMIVGLSFYVELL
jgi:hypothetical protein